jgi:hypothetical protein
LDLEDVFRNLRGETHASLEACPNGQSILLPAPGQIRQTSRAAGRFQELTLVVSRNTDVRQHLMLSVAKQIQRRPSDESFLRYEQTRCPAGFSSWFLGSRLHVQ